MDDVDTSRIFIEELDAARERDAASTTPDTTRPTRAPHTFANPSLALPRLDWLDARFW